MVSAPKSPSTPTITVVYQACRGRISLRQLAKDLGAHRSNLYRAKNWLLENKHPSFEGYIAGSSLTSEQANALIRYRSHTTAGIKGDALTEIMFPNTVTPTAKKNALRDLFEEHNVSPEKAAQLTYSILEIFNS